MLYALVLVITTTTVQPVMTGPAMAYAGGGPVVGSPLVTTTVSQQIIGYYRSERGCLGASLRRSGAWPDFLPGQTATGLCVQVEIPAGGVIFDG